MGQSFIMTLYKHNVAYHDIVIKGPTTKLVIKVNKNDIDLWSYNLPERDEFVTKVIRVMIKFNKGVVIRSNMYTIIICFHRILS
jgi:hypothetical protein